MSLDNFNNQTEFIDSTLLQENPELDIASSSRLQVEANKKPLRQNKSLILFLSLAGILVVLGILLLIFLPKQMSPQSNNVTETPVELEQNQNNSGLKNQLSEIKSELEAADPAKEELPFPPVNLELFLVEPE